MHFFNLLALALTSCVSCVIAMSALESRSQLESPNRYHPCDSSFYDVPQCCKNDLLDVAELNCSPPNNAPGNDEDFRDICASQGGQAKCCNNPAAGLPLLCNSPNNARKREIEKRELEQRHQLKLRQAPLCSLGLYNVPLCCDTDVDGVAAPYCSALRQSPEDSKSFKLICAQNGQQAMCCIVPVVGHGLLCKEPV